MKYALILILACCGLQSLAQVELNRAIILEGDSAHKKQVDGLSFPADSSAIVNAESIMAGYMQYYTVSSTAGDTIRLTHPVAFTPQNGTRLNFILPATNTGRLFINVNNSGALELLKEVSNPLASGNLATGQMVCMVYAGTHYQLLNPVEKKCPAGFTELNAHLCIQTNEFPTAGNFLEANVSCQNAGYKLCTWGEWYYACQKTGLGLLNMQNNYEWIDSGGNGTNRAVIVGIGGCMVASFSNYTSTPRQFRCCYSK